MFELRFSAILIRYLFLVGADVGAKAMAFTAMTLVIRRFGSAGFGETSFAMSVVTYGLMLGTCGLDVYAVRRVARGPEGLRALATTLVMLRLALGTITYVALLSVALLIPALRGAFGLVALFGLSLFTSALTLSWVAEGMQRTHVLALVNLATQGLTLLLLWSAVSFARSLPIVPTTQVLAEGIVAVGLMVWMRRTTGSLQAPIPLSQWRQIIGQAAPIGGAKVMRALAMGSDVVAIGLLLTPQEVGWYSGAYRIFLLCWSSVALYFVILFPRLARRAGESPAALRDEVQASLRRVLAIGLPAIALLALFTGFILRTLFNPSFEVATHSFYILLLALVTGLISMHYRNTLMAQGRQHVDLVVVASASLIHLTTKFALIPVLGIEGAAMGTFLGEGSLLVMAWQRTRFTATGSSTSGSQPRLVGSGIVGQTTWQARPVTGADPVSGKGVLSQ
jgi:O-antigen/teichoic acid export membrane protein